MSDHKSHGDTMLVLQLRREACLQEHIQQARAHYQASSPHRQPERGTMLHICSHVYMSTDWADWAVHNSTEVQSPHIWPLSFFYGHWPFSATFNVHTATFYVAETRKTRDGSKRKKYHLALGPTQVHMVHIWEPPVHICTEIFWRRYKYVGRCRHMIHICIHSHTYVAYVHRYISYVAYVHMYLSYVACVHICVSFVHIYMCMCTHATHMCTYAT